MLSYYIYLKLKLDVQRKLRLKKVNLKLQNTNFNTKLQQTKNAYNCNILKRQMFDDVILHKNASQYKYVHLRCKSESLHIRSYMHESIDTTPAKVRWKRRKLCTILHDMVKVANYEEGPTPLKRRIELCGIFLHSHPW